MPFCLGVLPGLAASNGDSEGLSPAAEGFLEPPPPQSTQDPLTLPWPFLAGWGGEGKREGYAKERGEQKEYFL